VLMSSPYLKIFMTEPQKNSPQRHRGTEEQPSKLKKKSFLSDFFSCFLRCVSFLKPLQSLLRVSVPLWFKGLL